MKTRRFNATTDDEESAEEHVVPVTPIPLCPDEVLEDLPVEDSFVVLNRGEIWSAGFATPHIDLLMNRPELAGRDRSGVDLWRDRNTSNSGHLVVEDGVSTIYLWGRPDEREIEALVTYFVPDRIFYFEK